MAAGDRRTDDVVALLDEALKPVVKGARAGLGRARGDVIARGRARNASGVKPSSLMA